MRRSGEEIIPMPEWRELPFENMSGTVMLIGGPDSGKSTLAEWLVDQLVKAGNGPVCHLDGDMGQSALGVPTTMNLAIRCEGERNLHHIACFFVGSTSPRGHMLPVLVGARRLLERAGREGGRTVVVDSTGMVSGPAGATLKHWKAEILLPDWIFFLQHKHELVHLLVPMRKDPRFRVVVLPVGPHVIPRSSQERTARRRAGFRAYFSLAEKHVLPGEDLPVYGKVDPGPFTLLGLENEKGLLETVALFLSRSDREWTYLAPDHAPDRIRKISVGSLRVDPKTGMELPS
ncbi:MAG: Clp1/GlmU family protein [Desulfovibrionales bacterium]